MTIEEARAFIAEAERLPADEVDAEKLKEAIAVLSGPVTESQQTADPTGVLPHRRSPAAEDAEWLRRAENIASKVFYRELELQRQIDSGEREQERGVLRPIHPGSAVPRTDDTHRLIPQSYRQRLREAAAGAGVPDSEVEAMLSAAEVTLAQAHGSGQVGITYEMLLGQTLADWEKKAEANAPAPIGVPRGFTAQVTEDAPEPARLQGLFGAAGAPRVREQDPRYFIGDQIAPASLAPEEIVAIQKRLVEAGLLETGKFYEGFWDDATTAAYETVLAYSNQRGTEWQDTLQDLIDNIPDELKEQQQQAAIADVFQEPAYMAPDYATLAQDVKGMFRSRLGRDPTEDELREMAGALSGSWKAAHDAAVAAARAEFDMGQTLQEQAEAGEELPEATSPGTFTMVDPAARFAELFEQRFKPEIDRLESLGAVRQNTDNVFASVRSLTSMIGGNQ